MTRRPMPLARLAGLSSDDRGLTTPEVRARRERFGSNDIVEVPARAFWGLLGDTARDPMIWFLIGTGVVYWILGERAEAATLCAAILPLAAMDAYLHRRTRASTEGLSSRLAVRARVLRDGSTVTIPALDIVPGDLAVVSTGEPFPADGILVAGENLQVDESALTGEAYPVHKEPLGGFPDDEVERALECVHLGFAGTRLLTGDARLRVALTGGETVYGQIVRSAVLGVRAHTPLQKAISRLVSILIGLAGLFCMLLAFVRLRQGYGWADALLSAVTLAVAALPEEFPVVFAFFLGVGVYRLGRRQALVRRAASVENIGRVSTICSDKTGTMTEGRLRLVDLVAAPDASIDRLLSVAALASRRETGDPLDAAILSAAGARLTDGDGGEVLKVFPFTEDRRRETVVLRAADGAYSAATKGSPEVILEACALAGDERDAWSRRLSELAERGHKIVACAWRSLDGTTWDGAEPGSGFHFLGLLLCADPVREGVPEAIARCRDAGIHPIMVTGDHPATARAVAREIGLGEGDPRVVTGDEMAAVAGGAPVDPRLFDVVARAIPSQKLALVRSLQERGEIVAVTGDGVNDVPALRSADIGIAMGERGTRSAREVASIVLLDDNFRTIVQAIAEGRQLFRNLKASFTYLLMVHIPLVLTAALIPLAGAPLLYLPIHIVWLETIIHPTALLVFQDLPAPGRLGASRGTGRERFFSRAQWALITGTGLLITALVMAGYGRSLREGRDVGHARAMALAVLTWTSAGLASALSRLRTLPARVVAGGTVGLTVLLVQTPALARLVHVRPLHLDDWALAAAASFLAVLAPLVAGSRPTGS